MHLSKVFLWSMVAALGLDALLGIAAILFPRYGPDEELLASAALFAAFCLVALLCAIVLEKRRLAGLMWAGIACSAASLALWLAMIWFSRRFAWQTEARITRFGFTFTTAAVLIGQCGLLSLLRLDQKWARAVRVATFASSASLGALVVFFVWASDAMWLDEDVMIRIIGVLAILTLCGTVVTPILWKVQRVRRVMPAESVPSRVQVSLTCPRCGRTQSLAAGRAACATCGLRIEINVEEPRCACGYLLHRLQGDRCPECGREIPASCHRAAVP